MTVSTLEMTVMARNLKSFRLPRNAANAFGHTIAIDYHNAAFQAVLIIMNITKHLLRAAFPAALAVTGTGLFA
jgi:pyrrolidone-carboxylate peptidase